MAQRTQLDDSSHPLHEAYACLLANGLDGAGQALRILVNEASRIERAQHLQATPYERSAQRVDYANGYKDKGRPDPHGRGHLRGAAGALGRLLSQRPGARQPLPEQAMNLALAEMYVQGVSTRKVIEVLQKLVGPEVSISSTQISRCTALLDTGLQAWRTRPLDETSLRDSEYGGCQVSCRLKWDESG
jgi:putative transposase